MHSITILQCSFRMPGLISQVFPRTRLHRSVPSEAELQGQLAQRLRLRKLCGAWVGGSCLRTLHSRVGRAAFFLITVLILSRSADEGVTLRSAANPPTKPGSASGYLDEQDDSSNDVSGEQDIRQGDGYVPAEPASLTQEKSAQQPPHALWQQQQQQQQQPKKPEEGQLPEVVQPWKNMFLFFNPQVGMKYSPKMSETPPPTTPPQPPPKAGGTLRTAEDKAVPPASVPQSYREAGRAPHTTGEREGKPLTSDPAPVFPIRLLMAGNNFLPEQYQLTPEEEEEEAIADAIIHGLERKRVPRIRTAVDTLVDLIEDQKLQDMSKTPRHLETLRRRRQADAKDRQQTVQLPVYFTRLAREAADYHRGQAEEREKKLAESPFRLGTQARKVAQRHQQKRKLLTWKENQIFQLPEDSPEVESRIAEALQTDKELERQLHEDLPREDMLWAMGDEEDEKSKESESNEKEVKGGEEQGEVEQNTAPVKPATNAQAT